MIVRDVIYVLVASGPRGGGLCINRGCGGYFQGDFITPENTV